jgi:hypothetical protein
MVGWAEIFIFMMYFMNFIVNRYFQYKTTSCNYIFLLRGVIIELSGSNTFVQPSLNFFLASSLVTLAPTPEPEPLC